MSAVIGIALALVVGGIALFVGFARDRSFFPTVLMVIASYYVLFGVMSGSTRAIVIESLVASCFLLAAMLGFRRNLWIVALALFAHGVFDFFHGSLIENTGTPVWWPAFCLTFDVTAAMILAWLLIRAHRSSRDGVSRDGGLPWDSFRTARVPSRKGGAA